ncbi:MAG: agmatine deiminase family protein [Rickettsiella sp.]|nr:agmatine deiminase family protein [Rickettsiella sp.]
MTYTNQISADATLLVIALPKSNDQYYKSMYDDIFAFDIAYAKAVMGNDNIIILADKKAKKLLRNELPDDIIFHDSMHDIWIRDFATVLPTSPTLFRYTATAQANNQEDADWVQKKFEFFIKRNGIEYKRSMLKLDGGNVVDDQCDKLVVTQRFLEDNHLDYESGKEQLKKITGFKQIAIIPADSEVGLAHADGMLMFIDTNTLVINKYTYPLREEIFKELNLAFPSLKIIEVTAEPGIEAWHSHFPSACGLNVNAVVTHRCIYMPDFGKKNDDKFLALVKQHSSKTIIRIPAGKVCKMGGSVRCLTWQLIGENAKRLILLARGRNSKTMG